MAEGMPAWKVTGSVPFTDFVPGRGPVEGYNLTVVTNTSITVTVFVPTTDLSNEEKVRAIITDRVSSLNNLHNLSG